MAGNETVFQQRIKYETAKYNIVKANYLTLWRSHAVPDEILVHVRKIKKKKISSQPFNQPCIIILLHFCFVQLALAYKIVTKKTLFGFDQSLSFPTAGQENDDSGNETATRWDIKVIWVFSLVCNLFYHFFPAGRDLSSFCTVLEKGPLPGWKVAFMKPPSTTLNGTLQSACPTICLLTVSWAQCASRIPLQ